MSINYFDFENYLTMPVILHLGQFFDKLSGRFLPAREYAELDMRRRAQMFVLTHLLSPLIAFGLAGLLYGGAGVASYPLLGLSLGFASFYIYPFLLRGVLSFRAASFLSTGQLTTLVLLTLYFFGGFSSFALPWIATIPILGMLYLGLRGAYSTTLIAAIGVSILFALHLLGHGFDDPIPVEWRNSVLMASIGLCILFNTGILFLHAGLYQIAQRASQERGSPMPRLWPIWEAGNSISRRAGWSGRRKFIECSAMKSFNSMARPNSFSPSSTPTTGPWSWSARRILLGARTTPFPFAS
jgi:hypothetical protein